MQNKYKIKTKKIIIIIKYILSTININNLYNNNTIVIKNNGRYFKISIIIFKLKIENKIFIPIKIVTLKIIFKGNLEMILFVLI